VEDCGTNTGALLFRFGHECRELLVNEKPVMHNRVAWEQLDRPGWTLQDVAAFFGETEHGLQTREFFVRRNAPDLALALAPVDVFADAPRGEVRRQRFFAEERKDVVVEIIPLLHMPALRLMPLDMPQVLFGQFR